MFAARLLPIARPLTVSPLIVRPSSARPVALRFLSCLVLAALCGSVAQLSANELLFREAAESNVNRRYTIESVSIGGVQVERAKLPSRLRHRLNAMVGSRCDMVAIGDLAVELRKELRLRAVTEHFSKGSQPGRIRVNFEVEKRDFAFEISVPKFLFHSRQGLSGEVDATAHLGPNSFTLGGVSNGDDLVERFQGIVARYENSRVFTDKARFRVVFENFQEHWNDATRAALGPRDQVALYRSRRNVAPEFSFSPVKAVTVSAGFSFGQTQSATAGPEFRSANVATADIRFNRAIEREPGQSIDAKYDLRVGMRGLGSDYAYSRHSVSLRYEVKSGRQVAADEFMVGAIAGDAPLFERFVLGTGSTLRGWDRYSINPLGGTRVAHNSMTYGYQWGGRTAEAFYDAGALWNQATSIPGKTGGLRHTLGFGYRQGIFVLTMAFPVMAGRVSPVLMAGMNY